MPKVSYKCENKSCSVYNETVFQITDDGGNTLHRHQCYRQCKGCLTNRLLSQTCCITTDKLNVILDLHGTLIDESCRRRPFVDELLQFLFQTCMNVSIWTASHIDYVQPFLNYCKKQNYQFHFVYWSKHTPEKLHCSSLWDRPEMVPHKPLRKVWRRFPDYTRHNTLIIDDTGYTYKNNYGNAIPVPEFNAEKPDDVLRRLISYIQSLQERLVQHGTIRDVEKRNWWLTRYQ